MGEGGALTRFRLGLLVNIFGLPRGKATGSSPVQLHLIDVIAVL